MSKTETPQEEPPASFTPGPWEWFANTTCGGECLLATTHSGRLYVMMFKRWGMYGAIPFFRGVGFMRSALCFFRTPQAHNAWNKVGINHPDARLIKSAPDLYEACKRVTNALVNMTEPYGEKYVNEDDWNSDAHIEVTMTIADARAIYAALAKANGTDTK